MNILDQIVSAVIRPTRDIYSSSDLGSKKFLLQGNNNILLEIQRTDEIILNSHKQKLHLSLYKVYKKNQEEIENERPTVVYVHANNGSRMQGYHYLKYLLRNQINVVLFDCTGSGLSDGDYITLGMKESEDLHCVIEHIIVNKNVSNISLWGRSMGAVTVLLYTSYSKRAIKCCIFDSPFANLKRLVKEIGLNKTGLPELLLTPILNLVQTSVEQKVKFKIFSVNPLQQCKKVKCPGLFLTSKSDRLVNSQHVEQLYNEFRSKKQLIYISQQHHEPRDRNTIQTCIQFILNQSQSYSPRKEVGVSSKLYQSQFISMGYQNKTPKTQRILGDLGDVGKMKQSLMIHSISEQQFKYGANEFVEIKKNERKSLNDKISISAFRKNSLKFKEGKKGGELKGIEEILRREEKERQKVKEIRQTYAGGKLQANYGEWKRPIRKITEIHK